MTSPYLSDPPAELTIPLTRGADYIFTVQLLDGSANPMNYPGAVYCDVDVRRGTTQRVTADVTGALATIRIQPTLGDTLTAQSSWRVLMADDTYDPIAEIPLLIGTFERHDS